MTRTQGVEPLSFYGKLQSFNAPARLPRPGKGSYRFALCSAALSGCRQPSCLELETGNREGTGDTGLRAAPGASRARANPRRWSWVLGYALGSQKGGQRTEGLMGGECQTRLARWGRGVAEATGEGGVMSELLL